MQKSNPSTRKPRQELQQRTQNRAEYDINISSKQYTKQGAYSSVKAELIGEVEGRAAVWVKQRNVSSRLSRSQNPNPSTCI